MTISGKTGDSYDIQTAVKQADGTTTQNLTGATVTCAAVEAGGHVVPADTCVISDAANGIVDAFFGDTLLGNGLWNFYLRVALGGDSKIVVVEPISVDDLLPEAS